jgi:hypothetical protein
MEICLEKETMKPYIHAKNSVRKFGGSVKDYIEIHQFLDSSKSVYPSNIHRCLTHTSWFLSVVLERVFGLIITNSEGKEISVRNIGEQHIMEDFGFIPTAQDFLQEMEYKDWMHGKGVPPSYERIEKLKKTTHIDFD